MGYPGGQTNFKKLPFKGVRLFFFTLTEIKASFLIYQFPYQK
jgi:hypothetical protein